LLIEIDEEQTIQWSKDTKGVFRTSTGYIVIKTLKKSLKIPKG